MRSDHQPAITPERSLHTVVFVGVVALAVAIGIGRFAFTPLLPLMMRDGTIDAAAGAEWAAANYFGYLIGALSAARLGSKLLRTLHLALFGVVVSTVLVAFFPAPLAGAALRFAAGVFSAWVLITASSWCLAELAREHAGRYGAWIYTGVGSGIALTGALTWLGGLQPAQLLWLELGLVAAAGAAYVFVTVPRDHDAGSVAAPVAPSAPLQSDTGLVLCYGIFGFGYIVPATFLPALARAQVANPLVFGLTWPLFGIAAALSVAFVARALAVVPRRRVWAMAQSAMAVGTALPVVTQALWSLAVSAVLVGGTFMVATMAGLQLARERMPANATPLLARMTAAFAAGQIIGPALVRVLAARPIAGWDAMTLASAIAAAALALTAIWLWRADGSLVPKY